MFRPTTLEEVKEYCPGKPIILVGLELDIKGELESKDEEPRAKEMDTITYKDCYEVKERIDHF